MPRVVVVRHRTALSARETHIQWEFGFELKGLVPQGVPETVRLAVGWVVTAVETAVKSVLALGDVAVLADAQVRWMTRVREKVDRALP